MDGDPLTLIDCGLKTPESRDALELAFDRLGLCLDDLQRIVLTHYHRDHLGQAQSLRSVGTDVEVWAHAGDVASIESYSLAREENTAATDLLFFEHGVPAEILDRHNAWRRAEMGRLGEMCEPTRVDRVLHDGDRVPFKNFELEVIHTPGHTAGHIVLHEERSGALVTGDHILGDAVPFTETYFTDDSADPGDALGRRPRFKGLPAYLESVRKLRRRSFAHLLPAHGSVLGRPDRLIEDALLFYDVRVQRIERGLRKLAAMGQDVTAWEMWTALSPQADAVADLRGSMFTVIGSLDVLEASGVCVSARRSDGIIVHRHAG